MSDFILVCCEEGGEPTEVSVEQDGSVELQSVTAAFPGTTSIKYRNPATQAWRLIKRRDEHLLPPPEGWLGIAYVTVRPDAPENGGGDGGKRTWSEAKEEAGWGEGVPEGKRQGQIASLMALASGQQEKEQWSTAAEFAGDEWTEEIGRANV